WALTELPTPLISLRKGMQGEPITTRKVFAGIDERNPMSAKALESTVRNLEKVLYSMELHEGLAAQAPAPPGELVTLVGFVAAAPPSKQWPSERLRGWLERRAKDDRDVRAARQRLAASGLQAERLKEMPALQVVLLDEKHGTEDEFDE